MEYYEEPVSRGTIWETLAQLLEYAKNKAVVLEPLPNRGREMVNTLQLKDKSMLGSVVLKTGGILVDNGWLKILGSGSEKICGNILSWNGFEGTNIKYHIDGALVVAYDVIGGFFAVNLGAFTGPQKQMYYFAPESLEWEDMELGYTDFINWALNGDLQLFYKCFRWDGWEKDLLALKGDQGFGFYPFLWMEEACNLNKVNISKASIEEIWDLQQEFFKNKI